MSELEQKLISVADKLRKHETLEDAQEIRRTIENLRIEANSLSTDPMPWALKQFYEYLDAKSLDAVVYRAKWLRAERAEIDRGLLDVLAAVKREEAVAGLTSALQDLDSLRTRIAELEPEAIEKHPLRCFLHYVEWKGQHELELSLEHERLRPTMEIYSEIEPPTMEMW